MLTIGEVSRRTGIAASALRYYEREGLIPRAERRGGKRVFGEDVLDRIALIQTCKTAGFTLREIQVLVRGVGRGRPPGRRWRQLAGAKLRELDARRAELERMARVLETVTRCECPTLAECARAIRGG